MYRTAMLPFKRAIARLVFAVPTLVAPARALGDDAPVERPAVDRPAAPQTVHEQPAPVERAATTHPAAAQPVPAKRARANWAPNDRRSGGFLYLEAGLGVLTGLSGGRDFERTNPALGGVVGFEIPLAACLDAAAYSSAFKFATDRVIIK